MIKEIETIKSDVEKKIADAMKNESEYEKQIANQRANIEDIEKEIVIADENCDIKQVRALSQKRRDSEDLIDMYARKLTKEKSASIVSEDEYKALTDAVLRAIKDYNQTCAQQVLAKVEEIAEICQKAGDEIDEANRVLSCIQYDLYRDKPANGIRVFTDGAHNQYREKFLPKLRSYLIGGENNYKSIRYENLKSLASKGEISHAV